MEIGGDGCAKVWTSVQNHGRSLTLGVGGDGFGWFVAARDSASRDGYAIPEIDHGRHEGQIDDFFFGEMLLQVGVDVVGGVGLRDLRYGFGPGEGGALAVGEEGSLTPGFEGVKTLLGFAGGARVNGMHVEAICTPVDLRGAHFHEVDELGLEAAFGNVLLDCKQVFEWLLGVLAVVETRLHLFSFRKRISPE